MRPIKKVKVLIVDDSILFQKFLKDGLSKDEGIEIVGFADDPIIAIDMLDKLKPDVITMDVEMPKMSGIEFLQKVLPIQPIPVVVVSSVSRNIFDALANGAVDFITKPQEGSKESLNSFINELIIKIKIASISKVGHLKREAPSNNSITKKSKFCDNYDSVIAIGASTGGTEAILSIIKEFTKDMPGVVVVQHMPPVFTKMYADRLNDICQVEVKEAEDGDEVRCGRVLIAPGEHQMEIRMRNGTYYVNCYKGEKVNGHSPSVDVLFNSVAETVGKNAIGVILTGMGKDGAKGLLNMRNKGAYTIGQDEESSVVYGMPMAAYNIGAVTKQLPLDKIAKEIVDYIKTK